MGRLIGGKFKYLIISIYSLKMFKQLILASLIPFPVELPQTDKNCRHPRTWNHGVILNMLKLLFQVSTDIQRQLSSFGEQTL